MNMGIKILMTKIVILFIIVNSGLLGSLFKTNWRGFSRSIPHPIESIKLENIKLPPISLPKEELNFNNYFNDYHPIIPPPDEFTSDFMSHVESHRNEEPNFNNKESYFHYDPIIPPPEDFLSHAGSRRNEEPNINTHTHNEETNFHYNLIIPPPEDFLSHAGSRRNEEPNINTHAHNEETNFHYNSIIPPPEDFISHAESHTNENSVSDCISKCRDSSIWTAVIEGIASGTAGGIVAIALSGDNPTSSEKTNNTYPSLSEPQRNKSISDNKIKFVNVNLQNKTEKDAIANNTSLSLLNIKPQPYKNRTIESLLPLYKESWMIGCSMFHSFNKCTNKKEKLDKFLETNELNTTRKFLFDQKLIENSELINILNKAWNWFEKDNIKGKLEIHFTLIKALSRTNPCGYIKNVKLTSKGDMIKISFNTPNNENWKKIMDHDFSPQLEIVLYTICPFLYLQKDCPVSLKGRDIILVIPKYD
ncbi:uncharacterized protein LOC105827872 isoform X2 [Monomorium pharaonis]|uniref:uncharacterized protein LOC105827872 isoform X2 n=1 Tax=Monomorium pharaonis TaxID=307658 RepID=UPI0017469E9A|nr:uncharacterized protein LOC105827872 isoform X2 [Monomorium pharaonis]